METIFFDSLARRNSFSVSWKRNFQRMHHSGWWKRIIWLVQTIFYIFFQRLLPGVKWKRIFLTDFSFRLAETDFLSSGKSAFLFRALLKVLKFGGTNSCLWKLICCLVELIFSHFSDSPSSESYFQSGANVFWNESSNPYGGDAFSVSWKPFSLI